MMPLVTTPQDLAQDSMQTGEFHLVHVYAGNDQVLKRACEQFGRQGWALVTITPNQAYQGVMDLVFRRDAGTSYEPPPHIDGEFNMGRMQHIQVVIYVIALLAMCFVMGGAIGLWLRWL
jgi:hypothetical protein